MLTDIQRIFVTIFTQALIYGIYLATLIQCLRWLIFTDEGWEPRQKRNFLMVFATMFIFSMSTINLATTLTYAGHIRGDVSRFHWRFGTVLTMNISEDVTRILIDVVLIHRCWVVYAKSWRVICVPVTLWLASLACSVLHTYYGGLDYKDHSVEFFITGTKTITGIYACNIVITIYSTAAIIYRILSSTRNIGSNHKRLSYSMRILAESGVLYTSMTIFSLIGLTLDARDDSNWVEWLISDISDPMAFCTGGISFNLILIRVYQSRVELRDSFVDSRDDYELSGIQFNNPQITASSERPSCNVLVEVVNEIQEHRRSRESMHEN